MVCISNIIGCLRVRLVMMSSWISRADSFSVMHGAVKWCTMETVSIGCTQLSSRDRSLIHEPQDLFGNIVRGVVSPILSNILLNKLDKYVETVLIPQYTRGDQRRFNPE